ncbi:MAG: thiol peroxidase [Bacteroides sp.]|nr:thiol peroxidase [Bacteroides sp.]
METVHFKETPCHTYGTLPAVGTQAPSFNLTGADLSAVKSEDYKGKTVVLNIFPSLDTDVCARSVRKFNEEASGLENTAVICVSEDLPFAMARFCTLEGLKNVVPASAFRSPQFGEKYGVMLVDGPLAGLLTRAVVVIGPDGTVKYRELVSEITREPDYEAALNAIKGKY